GPHGRRAGDLPHRRHEGHQVAYGIGLPASLPHGFLVYEPGHTAQKEFHLAPVQDAGEDGVAVARERTQERRGSRTRAHGGCKITLHFSGGSFPTPPPGSSPATRRRVLRGINRNR